MYKQIKTFRKDLNIEPFIRLYVFVVFEALRFALKRLLNLCLNFFYSFYLNVFYH